MPTEGWGHRGDRRDDAGQDPLLELEETLDLAAMRSGGVFDLRVFDQGSVWVDATGGVHRIQAMSGAKVAEVMTFLRRHVAHFYAQQVRRVAVLEVVAALPEASAASRSVMGLEGLLGAGPDRWLEETALMGALRARLRAVT